MTQPASRFYLSHIQFKLVQVLRLYNAKRVFLRNAEQKRQIALHC